MHARSSSLRSSARPRLGACLPLLGIGAGLSLAALAPAAHAGGKTHYTLTVLAPLYPNQGIGEGFGVNDSGQVVGFVETKTYHYHAFLSGPDGGPSKSLGTANDEALGINDKGQVVGYVPYTPPGGFTVDHAFLTGPNGGTLKDLGTLGGGNSHGNAVNAGGQVAGTSDTATSGVSHAFLYSNGAMKDLGTLGGSGNSFANGINASGQVAGGASTAAGGYDAFLSGANGGALKDLGQFNGDDTGASAVNASGQVIGEYYMSGGVQGAFLSGKNGGALQDLGTLGGGGSTYARGINDAGTVVGYSGVAGPDYQHAFVFSDGVMTDLNSLIAPGSGFTLFDARGISNSGLITGYGYSASGGTQAFLLTPTGTSPVPEASSVVSLGLLLMLGVGGVAVARRKRAA